MLGSDGRYFIHPDSTRLFRKTIASELDPKTQADIIAIGHEMIAGKEGSMHAIINGRYCHVTYMPLPSSKWSIAIVCPDNEILKNYDQQLYIIITLIIVGLAVILWICRRVVSHVIRPVNYLVDMTQQISEGHFDTEIPRSEREDAVGQLQNSFAIMQQSIEDHIGSIRQATLETRLRNEELVTAMKLAEEGVRQKNLFIQNVSHQIRTPLNIIQGFAQVLEESRNMPKKDMQEIRNMMKYNAMHLNRMVLMLFDSSDTGVMEGWKSQRTDQVSCNEIARESIQYTESRFPGLSIRFESDEPDSFQILTNHTYLLRTLRELLYNSAKYSDFNHISLRVRQTEATARFIIEDVGPGLSTEQLNKVFMPFNKVNDLSEGLGLGLSLARQHIISLGGDLELDTNYHDGCRFTIIMPK
jgi:signal transduction histidine kinase